MEKALFLGINKNLDGINANAHNVLLDQNNNSHLCHNLKISQQQQ